MKMNKVSVSFMLLLSLATPAFAADAPKSEEQKTLYAIGLAVSKSLAVFDLTAKELEIVQQGITEAMTGKQAAVDLASYNPKIQELAKTRRKALGEKQAVAGRDFLEKAAREKGAVKTESGMVYLPLTEGKGESPSALDTVKVNYRGTLIDGREFDSSYKRGKPLEFKLGSVIKCWTEGMQKMKPGGKAKLVCPAEMAYGGSGVGDMILPGATLAFEVELIEVIKGAASSAPATMPGSPQSSAGAPQGSKPAAPAGAGKDLGKAKP